MGEPRCLRWFFVICLTWGFLAACRGAFLDGSDAGNLDASDAGSHEPFGLVITRVGVTPGQVYAGQQGIEVIVRLENRSGDSITLEGVFLRFDQSGEDVGGDYSVDEDPDSPVQLPPAEGASLVFSVSVSGTARTGPVELDAAASGRRSDGTEVVADGAWETDSWVVVEQSVLLVTTADDEDDIGQQEPSVDSAGGQQDISLREALRVANTAASPQLIQFDPGVFDPGAAGVIDVDPDLGSFPAITNGGTRLDGSGIVIRADDVALEHITMRGFNGAEEFHCLTSEGANRVQLSGCSFDACGCDEADGASVMLRGGQEHRVEDCKIQGGLRDGLYLSGTPSSAVIRNNQMIGNSDDGFNVVGSGHLIEDNLIEGNGGRGIEAGRLTGVVFNGNRIVSNGRGSGSGVDGFAVFNNSVDVRIEDCIIEDNNGNGLLIDSTNNQITITACTFMDNVLLPIDLIDLANQSVAPPEITAFDGTGIEGASAAEGGTVEIYQVEGRGHVYVDSTTVSSGTFSCQLPAPAWAVAATVTTSQGSTSEFSLTAVDGPAELVVTTSDDELDGGEDIVSANQAGGAADLSLREAIHLANNRIGPDTITFDPAVFPPGQETSIFIGEGSAGAERLPTVIDSQTIFDGTGTGVVLDGGSGLFEPGTGLIMIQGHESEIHNLTVRNYNAPGGGCVYNDDSELVRVIGCTLFNCGGLDAGAGIWVQGSASQNELVGNTISNSNEGVHLTDTSDGLVMQNHIFLTTGACIYLYDSSAIIIEDNALEHCGGDGISVNRRSSHELVIGNRIWGAGGSCVSLEGTDVQQIEVVFNTMALNTSGVFIGESDGVTIRNNVITTCSQTGIQAAGIGAWSEDHNLFFGNTADIDVNGPVVPDPTDVLANPQLDDPAAGDMTPGAAVIDVGIDIGYDRNGEDPGLFNGSAPDIGAVETP